MSDYGYKQAKRAVASAYAHKGGMTVGLPKATMSADHLALFVKEYERLKAENHEQKKLLRECRKVMKANSLFRNTAEHRDLNLRLKKAGD